MSSKANLKDSKLNENQVWNRKESQMTEKETKKFEENAKRIQMDVIRICKNRFGTWISSRELSNGLNQFDYKTLRRLKLSLILKQFQWVVKKKSVQPQVQVRFHWRIFMFNIPLMENLLEQSQKIIVKFITLSVC